MRARNLLAASALLALLLGGPLHALTLKVVTYNLGLLKALGTDYVPLVDARAHAAPAVLARVAREQAPDLMLFEEVWYADQSDAIVKALSALGYRFVRPSDHGILGLTSGLLLAVRPPLSVEEWTFTPFKQGSLFERFTRKGVLTALVVSSTDPRARFLVVGTHMTALDTVNGAAKDRSQLELYRDQAAELLSIATAQSRGGELPVLLLGDFNTGPGYADGSYREIAGRFGFREAGESLAAAPIITWDPANPLVKFGEYPHEPPAKIDHIFLRDGLTLRWVPIDARRLFDAPLERLTFTPRTANGPVAVPLSDHYGFLADVELQSAP